MLIFGKHPVLEAIEAGKTIDKILLQRNLQGDFTAEIRKAAKAHDIPLKQVPPDQLNRISRKNHQGIIAFVSPIPFYKIEQVLPQIFERGEDPLIVILDSVSDVRNAGAIARSAVCFGAQAIVISEKGSARINEETMKASAGALNKIPVCKENLASAIDYLKNSGIRIFAADAKAEKDISGVNLKEPSALLLGSEGEGIRPHLLKLIDAAVKIPMPGNFDSLNVSVATGVMLYEAARQRNNLKSEI